jgi:hypothetical protein
VIRDGRRGPATEVHDPAELAAELERQRRLEAARRADELARERANAGHVRARADVAEEAKHAELARAERGAQALADVELAGMYRQFRAAGERTRIKSQMARSGEARALRLERLRVLNIKILVPLLAGFGIWSTTGVQQGAATLMNVDKSHPVWWVLWGLEALLIGVVCWIIIVRARLAASGGELSDAAEKTAFGCLTVSIFLNLVAAVPADGAQVAGWWAIPGAMFAHALGPVGAAVVAHLIGTIDKSISDADPWHDKNGAPVPRLADMDLAVPATPTAPATAGADAQDAQDDGPQRPVTVWPVPRGDRRALPVVLPVVTRPDQADRQVDRDDNRQDDRDDVEGVEGHQPRQDGAVTDPEAWVTEEGRVTAQQIERFLSDLQPPEAGVTSSPPAPADDGPQGAAVSAPPAEPMIRPHDPTGGQIDAEQDDHQPPGRDPGRDTDRDVERVIPAAEARRAVGASTRHRIAQHLADHPAATNKQTAAALGMSEATVKRHRRTLRQGGEEGGQ